MNFLVRSQIKTQARSYVAMGLAIILTCAFMAAAFAGTTAFIELNNNRSLQRYAHSDVSFSFNGNMRDFRKFDQQADVATDDSDNSSDEYSEANTIKLAHINTELVQKLFDEVDTLPEKIPGLRSAYFTLTVPTYLKIDGHPSEDSAGLSYFAPAPFNQPRIDEGKAPETDSEIVIPKAFAQDHDIKLGSSIELSTQENYSQIFRVVGFTKATSSLGSILDLSLFYTTHKTTANFFKHSDPSPYSIYELMLAAHSGVSQEELERAAGDYIKKSYPDLLNPEIYVTRHKEQLKQIKENQSSSNKTLLVASQFFPAIAALVCCGIIATTFEVMLTRRRRQIALLRCVGATGGQIHRMIVTEQTIIGFVFSLIGALLGGLTVTFAATFLTEIYASLGDAFVDIGFWPYIFPVIFGMFVTLIAGRRPAARISRVKPIEALVERDNTKTRRQLISTLRLVLGIVLIALGSFFVWSAYLQADPEYFNENVVFGLIGGGLIMLAGLLVVARGLLPWLARVLTLPFSRFSSIAQLAGNNIRFNPRFVGSTSVSLLLSICLIATVQITESTVVATFSASMRANSPVDVALRPKNSTSAVSLERIQQFKNSSRFDHGAELQSFAMPDEIQLPNGKSIAVDDYSEQNDNGLDNQQHAQMTPEEKRWFHNAKGGVLQLPSNINDLVNRSNMLIPHDGELYVNVADEVGIGQVLRDYEGQTVTLRWLNGTTLKLKVLFNPDMIHSYQEAELRDDTSKSQEKPKSLGGIASKQSFVISYADGEQLKQAGIAHKVGIFIAKFSNFDFDFNEGLELLGSNMKDISMDTALPLLLPFKYAADSSAIIVSALLLIAVLVAVVGISNTLSLSVTERAREHAVLRAIGYTKQQIFRMLILEALLMAIPALIIGLAASTLYSFFFVATISKPVVKLGSSINVSVNPLFVVLLVTGILLCCLLASLLPALRGARRSPVNAMQSAGE